jgi:hypothetical protein
MYDLGKRHWYLYTRLVHDFNQNPKFPGSLFRPVRTEQRERRDLMWPDAEWRRSPFPGRRGPPGQRTKRPWEESLEQAAGMRGFC